MTPSPPSAKKSKATPIDSFLDAFTIYDCEDDVAVRLILRNLTSGESEGSYPPEGIDLRLKVPVSTFYCCTNSFGLAQPWSLYHDDLRSYVATMPSSWTESVAIDLEKMNSSADSQLII